MSDRILTDLELENQVRDWMGEWVNDYDIRRSMDNIRANMDEAVADLEDLERADYDMYRATVNDRISACWQSDDWLVLRASV